MAPLYSLAHLRLLVPGLLSALLASGCCRAIESITGEGEKPAVVEQIAPSSSAAKTESAYQANGFPASMPKTRTAVPTTAEWGAAPSVTTREVPEGCTMRFVREWLKINCSKGAKAPTPRRIENVTGMGGAGADYFKWEKDGSVIDIVVRTQDGKKGTATFVTDRGAYTVGYNWPYGAPFPSTIFQ